MAKKKTAPVLRAQSGGEQPTPETPIITKSYSVRDDWKDKDVVNYVAFKSVDGEVQDLTVNGKPAGGGGGGGVTTATVTVTNNTNGEVSMPFSVVQNTDGKQYSYAQVMSVRTNTPLMVKNIILLPDGGASTYVDGSYSRLAFTGDITEDDGDIHITGNGTITIS